MALACKELALLREIEGAGWSPIAHHHEADWRIAERLEQLGLLRSLRWSSTHTRAFVLTGAGRGVLSARGTLARQPG